MERVRIGYGYRRRERDFAKLDCRHVFIDGPGTHRQDLQALVDRVLSDNHVLVLLAASDLGSGRAYRNVRSILEDKGVEVEVYEAPKPEPKAMGRPPKWQPSEEDDERFRKMWSGVLDGGYVVSEACRAMGEDPDSVSARNRVRSVLNRKYGSRGKR